MAFPFLCQPYPMTVIGSVGTVVAGSEQNVANDRLGRVWRSNIPGDIASITVDLGSVRPVDTFAFLATNVAYAAPASTLWLQASNAADFSVLLYDSGAVIGLPSPGLSRVHRNFQRTIPLTNARYWRVRCYVQTPNFDVGRLILGKALTASDTQDVGWTYKVVDLGENRRASTGLDDPTIRGKVLEYKWTWSWMNEAEARGPLLDILVYAGTTRNILLCLNPDAADLHNMIGFGKLQESPEVANTVSGPIDLDNAYEASFTLQSRLILNL